jgi:hypothetical protein
MLALVAALLALQDRIDLNPPIDTWYKVMQGSRQVGYYHETWRRSPSRWRYEYGYEGEFELTIRGKPHAEDVTVAAFLDEAFSPLEYSSEGHVQEASTTLLMFTHGDQRRVEIGINSWTLPGRDDVFALPTLTLYTLRQNETLSKPGRVTLRAVGKDKDGVDVILEVGEPVKREFFKKEATLLPVAFLKPFPAAVRETEMRSALVDRYGRIVEAALGNGTKIVMALNRAEAMDQIGVLHRHGRRDPMDKATALRNAALERAREARGDAEVQAPWPTVDSLDSDLSAAKKMLEEVRALKASGDLDDARKTYLKAIVYLKSIRDLAGRRRPAMLPEIEAVRDDAELAWDGAAQVQRLAGELFVGIKDLADRLDVEGLEKTQKELQSMRDRIEVERRPEREQIAAWAADVGTVVVKVRTRRELANARIDVTGITIADQVTRETVDTRVYVAGGVVGTVEEVNVVRPVAMADINGQLYTTGQTIQGTSIRVEKISRFSVLVGLRDEVREVPLRR